MLEFLEPLFFTILKWIAVYVVLHIVLSYIIRAVRDFGYVHSRWHHTFENFHFSPKEFYASVKAEIEKKQVSSISFSTMLFPAQGIFSSRLYLKIRQGDQMFLVCAAPYGPDFFVSLRFGETMNFLKDLIPRIPKYGPRLALFIYSKSYFEEDSDDMFEECVRSSVMAVIDRITDGSGVRGLSELDRNPRRTISLTA